MEPAKYFALVTKREKRACLTCEELGVVSAPLPPRIIEKCLASDGIVIDTVVSKYCNHTPLHRQSMILEKAVGLAISRARSSGDSGANRVLRSDLYWNHELTVCLRKSAGISSAQPVTFSS